MDELPLTTFEEDEYDDDDIIEETPEYSPKSDFNKAKLADDAVRKCIEARGREMRSGYWNTVLTKDGLPVKEWKEDTRKTFIATVKALRALLNPEVRRNKNFLLVEKSLNKKINDLFGKYAYEEWALTTKNDNKTYGGCLVYMKTGRKFMPEINSEVNIKSNPLNNEMTAVIGGWDRYINAYWDGLLEIYDKLFATLIDLADINNYFTQQLVYG